MFGRWAWQWRWLSASLHWLLAAQLLVRPERERLVNSYDNTVAYTDEVLAELIDLRRRRAQAL